MKLRMNAKQKSLACLMGFVGAIAVSCTGDSSEDSSCELGTHNCACVDDIYCLYDSLECFEGVCLYEHEVPPTVQPTTEIPSDLTATWTTSDPEDPDTDSWTTDDPENGGDDEMVSSDDGVDDNGVDDDGNNDECPDREVNTSNFPVVINGSTSSETDEFDGSCGDVGGKDYSVVFYSRETTYYSFDTSGSSFDTIMYMLEDECRGDEFTCDDDSGRDASSRFVVSVPAGRTVTVVVDGYSWDESGDFRLEIDKVEDDNESDSDSDTDPTDTDPTDTSAEESDTTDAGDETDGETDTGEEETGSTESGGEVDACVDSELGDADPELFWDGDTSGKDSAFAPTCGSSAGDESFLFTAHADGSYRFEVVDGDNPVSFDVALALYDEDGCAGEELVCDAKGLFDPLPVINRDMSAGDSVVVVVDGARAGEDGEYRLKITRSE